MTSRLSLQIYDEDTFSDELMGSVLLDVKDLLSEENKDGKFFWANVYGAPKGGSGDFKK
jgi:Ca2+-dependent lipid-binding protein